MKTQFKKGLMLFLGIMVSFAVLSETTERATKNSLMFTNPKMKSLSIPFKFVNNLIVIPVQVNNSDTLNFILDTGMSGLLITEYSNRDCIKLLNPKEFIINGLGNGDPLSAIVSSGNKIKIGEILGNNSDVIMVNCNYMKLSSKLGLKINGILGYPLFKNFIIEIDYDNLKVTFHNPLNFNKKKYNKKWQQAPLSIEGTKPYVMVAIKQCNKNKNVSVKLLIDSGASHNLWLDEFSNDDICLPDCTKYSYLGAGLNGNIYGRIGRLEGLMVGKYLLSSPIVCYPDSFSAKGYRGLNARNGSLGANVLKHFNVVFDYHDSVLYFRKNSNFNEKFEYNMSGLEVESYIPGLPVYMITNVDSGSVAEKSGLKVGDQIISAKGIDAKDITLSQLVKIFEGSYGKKVKVTVLRNGIEFKTTLLLEEYL